MAQRIGMFFRRHGLAALLSLCILSGIGTVAAAFTFQMDDTRITMSRPSDFSGNWSLAGSGTSSLSELFSDHGTLFITAPTVLTAELSPSSFQPKNLCLYFKTENLNFRLYADSVLVFEYGHDQAFSFGKTFGSVENLIDLDVSGSTVLLLELSPQSPNIRGALSAPKIGSRGSIILMLLQKKSMCLLVCILLLLTAAGLLVCSLFQAVRRISPASLFYLGCGVLLVAVWLSAESLLLQFLLNNKAVSYILANFVFLLLPVPFLQFLKQNCLDYGKILSFGEWIQCTYALLRLLFYVFDVIDFEEAEIVSHLPLLFNLILALVICCRERHNRIVRNILCATIVLCVSTVFSIGNYWRGAEEYINIVFIGILLFILILVVGIIRRAFAMQKQAIRAEFYKRCAYTDMMTELENRASFEQRMADLKQEPVFSVILLLFDLNNLKETNDSFGHSEGDRLIQRLAECLHSAFDGCAKTYRIGGDEFVTIFSGKTQEEADGCLAAFQSLLQQANQQNTIPLSVAVGCASGSEPDFAGTADDLFRLADARMYCDKQSAEAALPYCRKTGGML
ncbi:MAG: GGDEF domain-containing protein [Firmicutes bacterium]|nr:GGDEF domain-containing protein [Bacillota bacterium]